MNITDYAYIVGRLRALETKMLTTNLVERMIDATSAEDAFRVLNDFTLLANFLNEHSIDEFQIVFTKGIKEMLDLIGKMSPHVEVKNFLNLKYDFHNLKVVLKASLTKKGYADIKHALLDAGSLEKKQWEQFVLEGIFPPLTKGMHQTMADASAKFEEAQDPQIVDLIVDKHYLEEMLLLAQKLNSSLVINYLKRLIDLSNLTSFIRCKELDKEDSYLKTVMLIGGHINSEDFIKNYQKSYEDLKMVLDKKMYSEYLVAVLEEFVKNNSLLLAEKKGSEFLEAFMGQASKISFGPEPVFAFFWKFENHLQILRTILVSKLNQLPTEEIRENILTI